MKPLGRTARLSSATRAGWVASVEAAWVAPNRSGRIAAGSRSKIRNRPRASREAEEDWGL
jgi:hypothetical protein